MCAETWTLVFGSERNGKMKNYLVELSEMNFFDDSFTLSYTTSRLRLSRFIIVSQLGFFYMNCNITQRLNDISIKCEMWNISRNIFMFNFHKTSRIYNLQCPSHSSLSEHSTPERFSPFSRIGFITHKWVSKLMKLEIPTIYFDNSCFILKSQWTFSYHQKGLSNSSCESGRISTTHSHRCMERTREWCELTLETLSVVNRARKKEKS